MDYEKLLKASDGKLTKTIAEILLQGLRLIEKLDDKAYANEGRSSVGTHFRHCLDVLSAFTEGITQGQIDYTFRRRDAFLETNRQHAISRLIFVIRELNSLSIETLEKPVMVKLDELRQNNETPVFAWSSGKRELDFVQSHTVHHFALIAFKLRVKGIEVEENFGVAPSTLKFWEQQKSKTA